jgi:hypothetical protein
MAAGGHVWWPMARRRRSQGRGSRRATRRNQHLATRRGPPSTSAATSACLEARGYT